MFSTLYVYAAMLRCCSRPIRFQVGWDLLTMWHNDERIPCQARTVFVILFVMSAWSVGIMIDRALMYSAARKQSRMFRATSRRRTERQVSLTKPSPSPSAIRRATSPKLWRPALSEFQSASAASVRRRRDRSRQARSRALRRHRSRGNEARSVRLSPPSAPRPRSWACSARWSVF